MENTLIHNGAVANATVTMHAGKSRPLRVGVVGLGAWGACHVEAYASLRDVEIVAVCDAKSERARSTAERFDVPFHATRAEELWERDDLDAVSIATAENAHLAPVLGALESGVSVLVEKPAALSADEARQMQRAASTRNVVLMPGHILRFEPRYAQAKADIEAGKLGEVASVFSRRPRPMSHLQIYGARVHPAYVSMAHDIDVALWYLGGARVSSVRAWQKSVNDGANPDLVWAHLNFDNGALAVLQCTWLVPDAMKVERPDHTEIIGSRATVQIDGAASGYNIWGEDGYASRDLLVHEMRAGRAVGALREELEYFCDCVRTGTAPDYVPFSDAIHGLEIIEAVMCSAQENRDVTIAS